MQVSAEYNSSSHIAYICENDRYYTIMCTIDFFAHVVRALQAAYGKVHLTAIGNNGVFVTFGGAI